MSSPQKRQRVNLRLELELWEWVSRHARENSTTVTYIITQCLRELKQSEELIRQVRQRTE